MSEPPPMTVNELLSRADDAWQQLISVLDGASERDLVERRDAEGWSAKDHLGHLAHWEQSLIELLSGRSRRHHLGVASDRQIGDAIEEVNAAVQARERDLPLSDVLTDLRETHARTRDAIAGLSDEQLNWRHSRFVDGDSGDDPNDPVIALLAADTYEHFNEHRKWIEAILAG